MSDKAKKMETITMNTKLLETAVNQNIEKFDAGLRCHAFLEVLYGKVHRSQECGVIKVPRILCKVKSLCLITFFCVCFHCMIILVCLIANMTLKVLCCPFIVAPYDF